MKIRVAKHAKTVRAAQGGSFSIGNRRMLQLSKAISVVAMHHSVRVGFRVMMEAR